MNSVRHTWSGQESPSGLPAACLIKDGSFSGANIKIYEDETLAGGVLDAAGTPEKGPLRHLERVQDVDEEVSNTMRPACGGGIS